MKKLIPFICLVSFLFIGCNKENPEISMKLLSKIITTGRNPSIKVFNYDDNNNFISIEYLNSKTGVPVKKYEYTYKIDKLFTMEIYDKRFYYELTYSSDSTYLTRKFYQIPEEYIDYIFYYNNNGVIDSVNMYTYNTQYSFILDSNNNMMGYSHFEPSLNYTYNYEYDNMVNAYSSLPVEYRILNYLNFGFNNVTYYENIGEKISLSYEYDSEDYPIECIIQYQPNGNSSDYYRYDTLRFEYN